MELLYKLQNIEDIFSFVIKLIGLIGQVLILAVYSQPSLRKLSISIYIRTIALFCILESLLVVISIYSFNLYHTNDSIGACKLINYVIYIQFSTCVWLEVAATLDRLVTIVYPVQFQFVNNLLFQIFVISVILIYNLGFYFSTLFDYEIQLYDEYGEQKPYCRNINAELMERLHFYHSTAIPFFAMFFASCATFWGVLRAHRRIRESSSRMTMNRIKVYRRDVKFGVTLILLNVIFLVMITPFRVSKFYNIIDYYTNGEFYLIFQCAVWMLYELYYSIMFFVQIGLNGVVRREVFRMIRCIFDRCFHNRQNMTKDRKSSIKT